MMRVSIFVPAIVSMIICIACGGGGGTTDTMQNAEQMCTGQLAEAPAGSLAFLDPCDPCNSDACETGLCFNFPSKGALCSKPCTQPTDCESPSTGCNNMGVCKAP
jgi:hypothetical protein